MRAPQSPLPRRSPRTTRLLLAGALFASLGAAIASCSSAANPPGLTSTTAASGSGGAGGDDFVGAGGGNTPPPPDAGYLCGQLITQVHKDPPNLYFVLDTSGSMGTKVGVSSRFTLVHGAAVDLVANLGGLLNVGAALFPMAKSNEEACHAGAEVLPVTPGDMLDISTFSSVTDATPFGGTPTAATLEALYPTLVALPGRTIVVLATDGGPNCNADTKTCGAEDCSDNIEGACNQGVCCTPDGPTCCGPDSAAGPLNCIDRKASVAAVAKLAAAGIRVYVVGVPGSETYGAVLDQMALVSGAPQIAPPFYYKVEDYSSLSGTLASIAAIEVSCAFDLVTPPPDPTKVNVYLDDDVILQDPDDGWVWDIDVYGKPQHVILLRGEACKRLKSGAIKQVQIAAGCPTMGPK